MKLPYKKYVFEWDEVKNAVNIVKHHLSFAWATRAFDDQQRLIFEDLKHSTAHEVRYYCLGKIDGKVCTVRFALRNKRIRIFGAGYWRKEQ